MACGDFSLWYNYYKAKKEGNSLWLAGTSRYGTIFV